MTTPLAPPLTYLMSFLVEVGEACAISASTPARRFVPIRGGEIRGRVTGRILSGGGDWQTIRADGTIDLAAHYVVSLDDHGLVEVRAAGVRHAMPESVYFRTAIQFSTEAPGLDWLTRRVCLWTGRRTATHVTLDILELG